MASSSIVNSWTEWGSLEIICVGTVEGMCYPDETPSYPWHSAPSNLRKYIHSIVGPRPTHRIQQAQAQLDNLADLIRAESIVVANSLDEVLDEDIGQVLTRKKTFIKNNSQTTIDGITIEKNKVDVCRPLPFSNEEIRFDHQLATPHFKSQYQFGLSCPRDILITLGDTVVEAPVSVHTRYFESEYYKPLLYSLWRRDSNMKWLTPPKPTCSPIHMFDDVDFWKKINAKDFSKSIFANNSYKTNLNENEIAFDAADIMRMGKDVFYKKSVSANNQGLYWLRRTFPNLRFHMMHFPTDASYHLDVLLVPLRPPTSGSHGLVLINQNHPPLASEMKLFTDNDWRPIWAPMYSTGDVPPLALCSGNLNANLLSLNDHCVIIEECETALYRLLHDELGFDVITCPLRILNEFGGGIHCGMSC
jgi:glycine amidinotransferase